MKEHHWMKYAALAAGGLGLLLLTVLILNYGRGLEERTWVVEEMNIDGTVTAPVDGVISYAVFEDGAVSGSAGCNNYTGGYKTDGGSMTIGPVAATRMFCDGAMDQETAYFVLLEQVDSYKVSGNELTLSSGDTVLIKYSEGTVEDGAS
jgi:heat shock protein HslJ